MFLCFDGLLTWNCLGEDWIMELRLGKCVGKYVRLGKYVRIICSASYVRCLCQVPSKCLPIPQISSSSSSRALFPELWPLRITSAGSRALWHQAGQPHQWGALGRRLEVRREESVTRVLFPLWSGYRLVVRLHWRSVFFSRWPHLCLTLLQVLVSVHSPYHLEPGKGNTQTATHAGYINLLCSFPTACPHLCNWSLY